MINKIKKIFGLSSILLCGLLFNSCFDPIFFEIRNDIQPEEATVSGIIQSIARFQSGGSEYILCLADGGVRYKLATNEDHGAWASMGLPFESIHYDFQSSTFVGEYPIAIAADSNYIYLASIKLHSSPAGTNDPSELNIRCTNAINGSWSSTWSVDRGISFLYEIYNGYTTIDFNMFCTNAPQNDHRKAYFREGKTKLYELNGTSKTEVTTGNTCLDSNSAQNWNSAVYFGNDVFFFKTNASETNETNTTAATKIYYGDDTKLYYSSTETPEPPEGQTALTRDSFGFTTNSNIETNYQIRSIAVCSDRILISKGNIYEGYGGISAIDINANGVPGSLTNAATHADLRIPPNYIVFLIFNATPGNTETNSILYATTGIATNGTAINVSYKDVGLFAYFPNRNNWNRE